MTKLHELENRLTAEKNKPPVIKEIVRTQTQTEISYVPKKTVKYINSKTAEEVTAKELENMNINIRPTEFQFSVNGNPSKFIAEKGERWVFDQNKGKLDQWSQASINIKIPIEDRTMRTALIPSGLYDADKNKIQPGGDLGPAVWERSGWSSEPDRRVRWRTLYVWYWWIILIVP